jgi:hypothetical protein
MVALCFFDRITSSGWIGRWGRFSNGAHQDRADVVDEDIQGLHIDGLVNFAGVKVLWLDQFRPRSQGAFFEFDISILSNHLAVHQTVPPRSKNPT